MEISEREQGVGNIATDFRLPSEDHAALPPWADVSEYDSEYKKALGRLCSEDPRMQEIKRVASKTVGSTEEQRLDGYRQEIWKKVRRLELEHCIAMFRRDIGPHMEKLHTSQDERSLSDQLRSLRKEHAEDLKIRCNPKDASSHINQERKRVLSELKPLAQKEALEILAERWRQKQKENHEIKEEE